MTDRRLVLVRHADALARSSWDGPDADRPLTAKGQRQADALAAPLAAHDPLLVLTSPARRCADTVAPLARLARLSARPEPLLAEGCSPDDALALLLDTLTTLPPATATATAQATNGSALVACSHGDVIDGIAVLLATSEADLEADQGAGGTVVLETPKAGRWEIDVTGDRVRRARLVGPPNRAR